MKLWRYLIEGVTFGILFLIAEGSGPAFEPALEIGESEIGVSWKSQFGCTYQLQGSAALSSWQDLGPALTGDGTVHRVVDPGGDADRRFYRVTRTCSAVPLEDIDVAYPPPPGGDPAMSLLDLYYLRCS